MKHWKTWNWMAAIVPIFASIYLTYQEIRDDHDDNPPRSSIQKPFWHHGECRLRSS